MKFTTNTEAETLQACSNRAEDGALMELGDMQLALVGGGSGDVTLS